MSCVWLALLFLFSTFADVALWAAFILGVLLPVSLWMAFEGPWIPHPGGIDHLLRLTPRQFEEAVAKLMEPLGFSNIRVVGGAADLGVDVTCRDKGGRKIAIQCKLYQPHREISSSAVQTFMGGMVAHDADIGMIVTTSAFTGPARDLATRHEIRLIDGVELGRLIHEHNLSVEG
jgi:restriction endonuclease Mrr